MEEHTKGRSKEHKPKIIEKQAVCLDKLIAFLDELTPEKYEELYDAEIERLKEAGLDVDDARLFFHPDYLSEENEKEKEVDNGR